jgi:hypothetical protein
MNFQVRLFLQLRVSAEIGDIPRDVVVSDPETTEQEGEERKESEKEEGEGRGETLEGNRRSKRKYGAARWKRK